MFNFLRKKKKTKNFKEILKQFEGLEKKIAKISEEFGNFKKESKFFVQKVGIVRYNPFSGIGGDQSFSIALLDGNNNGLVITSIYARDGNRIYGKPVENGKSEYSLSEEEKKTIERAMSPK